MRGPAAGGLRRRRRGATGRRGPSPADRQVRRAGLRDLAAGRHVAAVRGRAGRDDPRRQERQEGPSRSSTCTTRSSRGGEQGLLSLAFAPDYATSGLFYVYYTNKAGNERWSSTSGRPPTARTRLGAPGARAGRPGAQPQRRLAAVRAGQAALHRDRRRRRGGRPARRARQRAEPGHADRQDPADRPAGRGRQAVHGPGRQPVRRPCGRARRDLGLRPAQPVALLLRPRAPDHRRRRPGRGRGDRLRRLAARATTSAGASSRATRATRRARSAPGRRRAGHHRKALRRQLLDHRRRRDP